MSYDTQAAFKRFAGMAYLYFGRDVNAIPADTLNIWVKEVGGFPAEFFTWALEHVKSMDSGRTITSNLPKVVKELWGQWLRVNPDKAERAETSGCRNPHCEDGRFWVFQEDKQTRKLTKRIAICAECKKLGSSMTCGLTRDQAVRAGYLLPSDHTEATYLDQQTAEREIAWERYSPSLELEGD